MKKVLYFNFIVFLVVFWLVACNSTVTTNDDLKFNSPHGVFELTLNYPAETKLGEYSNIVVEIKNTGKRSWNYFRLRYDSSLSLGDKPYFAGMSIVAVKPEPIDGTVHRSGELAVFEYGKLGAGETAKFELQILAKEAGVFRTDFDVTLPDNVEDNFETITNFRTVVKP